eukprot:g10088.t1
MGASACCFTADNVREEAKAHLTDATFKDRVHVQFNEEAAAESSGVPGEVKTQRTKEPCEVSWDKWESSVCRGTKSDAKLTALFALAPKAPGLSMSRTTPIVIQLKKRTAPGATPPSEDVDAGADTGEAPPEPREEERARSSESSRTASPQAGARAKEWLREIP